jgi:hypothetical protein
MSLLRIDAELAQLSAQGGAIDAEDLCSSRLIPVGVS